MKTNIFYEDDVVVLYPKITTLLLHYCAPDLNFPHKCHPLKQNY